MTQSEFIKMSSWPSHKLWKYCVRLTEKLGHAAAVDHLMKLRREMQQSLASYSKGKSFDVLQNQAVVATEHILRWCKGYFMQWATKEVIMKFPEKAANPNSVKYVTRDMWEKYVGRFKY